MTSEICQEKATWEAPRAGGGGGGGVGEKKKDTLLSHPELYDNP